MNSVYDDVHGRSLTIKELYTRVEFPTPSDALFAALIAKYTNASMELFDDLLSLFRHPEFVSKEVTLRYTEDAFTHISEQRKLNAKVRQVEHQVDDTNEEQTIQPVPGLAVGLVADYLDSARTPFHRVVCQRTHECDADRTLRVMALVHRSWTDAAQYSLRRRIVAGGRGMFRLLLQSPILGPWVRELSLKLEGRDGDSPRLIGEILKKCPSVKRLYLEDFLLPDTSLNYPDFHSSYSHSSTIPYITVSQIGDMTQLEHLWLFHSIRPSPRKLHSLPVAIHRLRHLKSLNIFNFRTTSLRRDREIVDQLPSLSDAAPPNSALKYLSIGSIHDGALLGWLLNPSEGYMPSALSLTVVDTKPPISNFGDNFSRDPLPFLGRLSRNITKLMLIGCGEGDDISGIIIHFPVIISLCLCLCARTTIPCISLPKSVCRLEIRFTGDLPVNQDQMLVALLLDAPHIREVICSFSFNDLHIGGHVDGPIPSAATFSSTVAHCIHNGVEFSMKKSGWIPSYLDL